MKMVFVLCFHVRDATFSPESCTVVHSLSPELSAHHHHHKKKSKKKYSFGNHDTPHRGVIFIVVADIDGQLEPSFRQKKIRAEP
jgi:hypothetical protein